MCTPLELISFFTFWYTYIIHTYIHTYIPWIPKFVMATIGCGKSHIIKLHNRDKCKKNKNNTDTVCLMHWKWHISRMGEMRNA